jgi:8-oxo-dGTP pyrophosphatase MutT (NUDIX family)
MADDEHSEGSAPSWARVDDGAHDVTLVENWLLRFRKERFQSRTSGKVHDYYVMHLADGVHVIAIDPDNQVVMVRQFRAGSQRDSLETPGGLMEPGEDPASAGARELLEETGYAGDPPELLGTIYPIPALLSMQISTIVIRNARKVAEPQWDPSEELVIELVPAGDVFRLIQNGSIEHGGVVAGLFWWMMSEWPGAPGGVPSTRRF